jgi:hypothetical protein
LAGALYVQQEKSWDIGTLSLFFSPDFVFAHSLSLWVCHMLVLCVLF